MNAVNNSQLICDLNEEPYPSTPEYQVVDKRKVALGFDHAASKYNSIAVIQQEIAEYGLQKLNNMCRGKVSNLLDVGCGTARSSTHLQEIAHQVTGVDISFNMLRQANLSKTPQEKAHFTGINGDAEALPFQSNSFDIVYSSMAMQWCQSPQQVLAQVDRVLKPKGSALLCIMTGESFGDLQNAWHHLGLASRINKFHSQQSWLNASENLNWSVKSHSKHFSSHHKSVLDMLGSIKRIGANTKLTEANSSHSHNADPFLSKQEIRDVSQYLSSCNGNADLFALKYQLVFLEINK